MNDDVRVCRLCGAAKPATEYCPRKDSGKMRSECKTCLKNLAIFRTTGWSHSDYESAFAKQEGKCGICHTTLSSSRYSKLCGDHCHTTGKLRGLLCANCNTAIGLFKDSTIRLRSAIEYLNKHTQG